jgi:hypothetical protein
MPILGGFFNSVGGDRMYDAEDMNKFFDGILDEGVFEAIGDSLVVVESSGMQVAIGSGRAWFLKSWIENTADAFLTLSDADVTYDRIDIIALDFDKSDLVRANNIVIVEGTPASSPVPPTLIDTATHLQIPLAHIDVGAGVTAIYTADITSKIGTVDCPYATTTVDLLMSVDDVTIEIVGGDLQVKDDGITQAKIGPLAVDTPEIAADAITGDKIEDDAIDSEHIADDAVDSVHYAAGSIDLEHMAPNSVDSPQYVDGSIDLVHMSPNSVDSPQIVDGSIDLAHLAPDSVDDSKAGDRIIQVAGRQGNSATDWSQDGSNNYTPGPVKTFVGARLITTSSNFGSAVITLPFSFAYKPLVWVSQNNASGGTSEIRIKGRGTAVNQITINVWSAASSQAVEVAYFVMGPE